MATYTKLKLSGSTDGMGIKIVQIVTAGDTIHTAHATAQDEIWCWVSNLDSAAVTITIEWGGATDPDNLLVKSMSIPANSAPVPVVTGQILTNSKVFKMFASSANKIIASGYVNRIA